MLKTITILAALAAVAMSAPNVPDQGILRENIDNVSYGDCATKPDGNYLHPWDCTRFITCSNGRASDMACGDCDLNNVAQCQGNPYLVYKPQGDYCEWPALAICHAVATTEDPVVSTKTSPSSTVEPTTENVSETTKGPVTPVNCRDIVPGSPCDVDCDQCNWCEIDANTNLPVSHYFRCQEIPRTNPFLPAEGFWVAETCDSGHMVDTTKTLAAALSGGQCTPWDDINDVVKDAYKSDINCIPILCSYEPEDANNLCSPNYYYIHTDGSKELRTCPTGTVWNQKKENCVDGEKAGCI